jgi:uncharacterized membrane protein (UPF0182 family)
MTFAGRSDRHALLASPLGWGVLVLLLLAIAAGFLGELLWFEELGYAPVFWRILLTRLALLAVSMLVVSAYVFGNLLILQRRVALPGIVRAALYRGRSWPRLPLRSATGASRPCWLRSPWSAL